MRKHKNDAPRGNRSAGPFPNVRTSGPPPLKVIHVGQILFRTGIESWLKSLLRFVDKRSLQFQRCVVTSPVNDVRVMREFDVLIEVGGRESVRRAASDCDVLLVSGAADVAEWLGDI